MALVVLANLCCIIAMTEWTVAQTDVALGLADKGWEGVSLETFEMFEYIFFCIYFVDVVVRIVTLRREWYYDEMEGIMYLNIFDGVLVLINLSWWHISGWFSSFACGTFLATQDL